MRVVITPLFFLVFANPNEAGPQSATTTCSVYPDGFCGNMGYSLYGSNAENDSGNLSFDPFVELFERTLIFVLQTVVVIYFQHCFMKCLAEEDEDDYTPPKSQILNTSEDATERLLMHETTGLPFNETPESTDNDVKTIDLPENVNEYKDISAATGSSSADILTCDFLELENSRFKDLIYQSQCLARATMELGLRGNSGQRHALEYEFTTKLSEILNLRNYKEFVNALKRKKTKLADEFELAALSVLQVLDTRQKIRKRKIVGWKPAGSIIGWPESSNQNKVPPGDISSQISNPGESGAVRLKTTSDSDPLEWVRIMQDELVMDHQLAETRKKKFNILIQLCYEECKKLLKRFRKSEWPHEFIQRFAEALHLIKTNAAVPSIEDEIKELSVDVIQNCYLELAQKIRLGIIYSLASPQFSDDLWTKLGFPSIKSLENLKEFEDELLSNKDEQAESLRHLYREYYFKTGQAVAHFWNLVEAQKNNSNKGEIATEMLHRLEMVAGSRTASIMALQQPLNDHWTDHPGAVEPLPFSIKPNILKTTKPGNEFENLQNEATNAFAISLKTFLQVLGDRNTWNNIKIAISRHSETFNDVDNLLMGITAIARNLLAESRAENISTESATLLLLPRKDNENLDDANQDLIRCIDKLSILRDNLNHMIKVL